MKTWSILLLRGIANNPDKLVAASDGKHRDDTRSHLGFCCREAVHMFQILIMYKGKMPTPFIAALKERRLVAEQTLEFVLQRPNGFEFQAGQSVNLKVFELTFEDARQGRRSFTIASPPHEENLVFATRLTGSGFKNTLLQGPLQEIEINGPHGKMVHDPSLPAVFIAGGIGVTPFRSMTLQALRNSTGKRITF